MAKAVLVDLFHLNSSQHNRCLQECIAKASRFIDNNEEDSSVYLMTGQCPDPAALKTGSFPSATLPVQVLSHDRTTASLYSFKQAVDKLGIYYVHIITSTQRKTALQMYQELLFTAVYRFSYFTLFDSLECPHCSASGTGTQLADVRDEVSCFLQRLPAVCGEITILSSSIISDCFSHGFSTRTGGVSSLPTLSALNLFCSSKRRDARAVVAENLRRLSVRAGFQPDQFHLVKTNHASDVWVMGRAEPESYDGIVTNQAGIVIGAPGADCMPLLFTDPVAKVIGVAHAGWKGTLMGIAMATVNAMVTEFGSKPCDVRAVIGPSVGPCCFRLEESSAREFSSIHPDCTRHKDTPSPYVDIRLATRLLLERGGLLPQHIHDDRVTDRPSVTLCTSCHPESFFSHVRDGNNFGTQIGFLWIKDSRDVQK